MRTRLDRYRAWLPGLLTALLGAAGVRLAAPLLTGRPQAVLVIVGYLLVPVGLGLIARQIYRQAERRAIAAADPQA